MFEKSEMTRAQQLKLVRAARRLGLQDNGCLLEGFNHVAKMNGQLFKRYDEGKAYIQSLKQSASL